MGDLLYSVESVSVRRGYISASGWCLNTESELKGVELEVEGSGERLVAQYGLARGDVGLAFPGIGWAANSGFLLMGRLPRAARALRFCGKTVDGLVVRADHGFALHDVADGVARTGKKSLWSSVIAASRHVLRGDWRSLLADAHRRLGLETLGFPDSDPAELLAVVRGLGSPVMLVIDHNMGGGSNVYRNGLVEERSATGSPVLLVYFELSSLRYCWRLLTVGSQTRWCTGGMEVLKDLFDQQCISQTLFNNCVSFPDPLSLLSILTWASRERGARIVFPLHDYYCICPSYPLIDYQGKYCGIPDIGSCKRCMEQSAAPFLYIVPRIAVSVWRSAWSELLALAHEIIVFSRASRDVLLRAYPSIADRRISFIPHRMDHFTGGTITPEIKGDLHIGIVGHINYLKGAEIVAEMVKHIDASGLSVRITVFGNLEHAIRAPCLRVTGRYEVKNLHRMIVESGANVFFLPSIWPETFSFVTQEMIEMKLPVAAFDLGAPAERLRGYRKGFIIEKVDGISAVQGLLHFHQRLRSPAAVVREA